MELCFLENYIVDTKKIYYIIDEGLKSWEKKRRKTIKKVLMFIL